MSKTSIDYVLISLLFLRAWACVGHLGMRVSGLEKKIMQLEIRAQGDREVRRKP